MGEEKEEKERLAGDSLGGGGMGCLQGWSA